MKDLIVLDDTYPHWGGQSVLLSIPTEMLISSGNTSQTYPEIKFNLGNL